MPLSTQYELLSNIERTLTFSTKWMLNYLDSEQIDSAHILDYKDRLHTLLNTLETDEIDQELVADNEHFNRFFTTIDYLRFAVAAIVIKEHTDNTFETVANLFYLIFRQMKIMKLLKILDDLKINEDADREIKAQMLHYIEFIVVNLTQKILSFQRAGESPQEAFENYLNSDTPHFEKTVAQIDKLLSEEYTEVKEVVITINQLMVMAL